MIIAAREKRANVGGGCLARFLPHSRFALDSDSGQLVNTRYRLVSDISASIRGSHRCCTDLRLTLTPPKNRRWFVVDKDCDGKYKW